MSERPIVLTLDDTPVPPALQEGWAHESAGPTPHAFVAARTFRGRESRRVALWDSTCDPPSPAKTTTGALIAFHVSSAFFASVLFWWCSAATPGAGALDVPGLGAARRGLGGAPGPLSQGQDEPPGREEREPLCWTFHT